MRGYGFVNFEREDDAQTAMGKVNGTCLGDRVVEVHFRQKREEKHSIDVSCSNEVKDLFADLYVAHIPDDWNDDTLQAAFEPFGKLRYRTVTSDSRGRKS